MLLNTLTALSCLVLSPDIDTGLAARCFAEARELSELDGGHLWGRELYERLIFIDAEGGRIVANQAGPSGELTQDGEVWVGPLPDTLGVANTAQPWQGELWTTVIWPLPDDKYNRRKLLAHEMFHRLQPTLGECAFEATPNDHLDTGAGRAWLRLEWRALVEALIMEGSLRERALTDALLFRATRHELFDGAHAAEVALESNEGVAEYTGLKLCGLPEAMQRDRAASRLSQDEHHERLGRSFAYASGPAYGVLLDAAAQGDKPSWRAGFAGTVDFGAVAAELYGIQLPDDVSAAARQRLEPYEGERVLEQEAERERGRQRRLDTYRARFFEGPNLVLPASGEVRYSFNPNRVESLPGAGQVYEVLSVTDAWGQLDVSAGGALMERDAQGRVLGFRVPAPGSIEDTPLGGDGWSLELAEGWVLAEGERAGDFVVRSP